MTVSQRRFKLREATAEAHQLLDDMVGHFDTSQDYRRYLAGIATFRLAVEPMLAPAADGRLVPGWKPGLIGRAVRQDLDDLGLRITLPTPGIARREPDQLLGIGYVLEGSALGARLLRQRALALGFTETFGARHLAAQTASPDGWRDFLAALDAHQELDMDNVRDAANETFAIAQRSFGNHADAA